MTKANCPTLAEWCGDVWLDAIPVRLASVPRPDHDAADRLRAEFDRVYAGRAGAVTPSMDGPVPRGVLGAAETNGYPHGRAACPAIAAAFAPVELTAEEADELDAIVYGGRA